MIGNIAPNVGHRFIECKLSFARKREKSPARGHLPFTENLLTTMSRNRFGIFPNWIQSNGGFGCLLWLAEGEAAIAGVSWGDAFAIARGALVVGSIFLGMVKGFWQRGVIRRPHGHFLDPPNMMWVNGFSVVAALEDSVAGISDPLR